MIRMINSLKTFIVFKMMKLKQIDRHKFDMSQVFSFMTNDIKVRKKKKKKFFFKIFFF
jgi:hypothetical protein